MDAIICLVCNKASSYMVCESCMHINKDSYDPKVLLVSWGLLCLSKCYKCCIIMEDNYIFGKGKVYCVEVMTQNSLSEDAYSEDAYSELMVKSLRALGWFVTKGRWCFSL